MTEEIRNKLVTEFNVNALLFDLNDSIKDHPALASLSKIIGHSPNSKRDKQIILLLHGLLIKK